MLLLALPVYADGPHIALHGTQGPYTATLFTAPDPLVTGKVAFALLVQEGENGAVAPVRAGRVALRLGAGAAVEAVLLRSGNDGLLQGSATVEQPGMYAVDVQFPGVHAEAVRLTGVLPVAENHGRRSVIFWFVGGPAVIVLLFLAIQHGKQSLRVGRAA